MKSDEIQNLWFALDAENSGLLFDFARFLLDQENQRWGSSLADPKPRPRLDAFLHESALEEESRRARP